MFSQAPSIGGPASERPPHNDSRLGDWRISGGVGRRADTATGGAGAAEVGVGQAPGLAPERPRSGAWGMPGIFQGTSNRRRGGGPSFRGGGVGAGGGRGEEDMGPAEFGLLMGEEGHEGGQEPLLADDWVRPRGLGKEEMESSIRSPLPGLIPRCSECAATVKKERLETCQNYF